MNEFVAVTLCQAALLSIKYWDKHNVHWFPTLNLGKKEYRERNSKMAQERTERANARQKSAIRDF